MKIYSNKTYLDLDDISRLLKEVKSQVETLEALNEELDQENEKLRREIAKLKMREEKIA